MVKKSLEDAYDEAKTVIEEKIVPAEEDLRIVAKSLEGVPKKIEADIKILKHLCEKGIAVFVDGAYARGHKWLEYFKSRI